MKNEHSDPSGLNQPALVKLVVSGRVKMLEYIQSRVLAEAIAGDALEHAGIKKSRSRSSQQWPKCINTI